MSVHPIAKTNRNRNKQKQSNTAVTLFLLKHFHLKETYLSPYKDVFVFFITRR